MSLGCGVKLTFGLAEALLAMPGVLKTIVGSGFFPGHLLCVTEKDLKSNNMDLRGLICAIHITYLSCQNLLVHSGFCFQVLPLPDC